MIRVTLQVRGTSGIAARFRSTDARLQAEARKIVKEAGEFCRDLTSFLAPRDTGFMADHVVTEYSSDGLEFATGWREDDFTNAGLAFYPPFQEFGTSRSPAQPSLGPAFEETVPRFKRDLSAALRRAARRAA